VVRGRGLGTSQDEGVRGGKKRAQRRVRQGGKGLRGFKPLKVISKYISFKGLKGRGLM